MKCEEERKEAKGLMKKGQQPGERTLFRGMKGWGLIAGHYLPKLPQHTNIRIKTAPTAPAFSLDFLCTYNGRQTLGKRRPRTPRVIIIIAINGTRENGLVEAVGASSWWHGLWKNSAPPPNDAFIFSLDPPRALLRREIASSCNWMTFI